MNHFKISKLYIMISPYQPSKEQRVYEPKIRIYGKRKIKKDNIKYVKIKRKCNNIIYYY